MKGKPTQRPVPGRVGRVSPTAVRTGPPGPGDPRPPGGARLQRIEARRARFRATLLLLAVLLVLAVAGGLSFFLLQGSAPDPELTFLQNGTLVKTVTARCLLIREETAYPAPSDGILRPMAAEGTRVPARGLLAYVTPKEGLAILEELQGIEQQIAELQRELLLKGKGQSARAIFDEADQNLSVLADLMRRAIVRSDLSTVDRVSASMRILIERRTGELDAIDFKDGRLDLLIQARSEKETALGKESGSLSSLRPGIVTYATDGLEAVLNSTFVSALTSGEVVRHLGATTRTTTTGQDVQAGTPVLRVVESPVQHLVFLLKDVSIGQVPPESLQTLRFPLEGGSDIVGRVVRVAETEDGLLLVLRTDRYVERFADRRTVDAELVLETDRGIKVPLSSFASFDKEKGTATLKIVTGGYVRLAPVLVVASDRDEAIVKPDPAAEYKIEVYGILVLDPASIEEGEYIG